jgi:L-lactate utilization protein LutC
LIMSSKNAEQWTKIPSAANLNKTVEALKKRNLSVIVLDSKAHALQKLKEMIPAGAEVMTGSSTTLQQIGFTDYYLSGKNPWKCLATEIRDENDGEKRAALRRKSVTADYFLGSVGAVAETGELVAVDQSGSRVGAYPFAAKKVILVVGYQKITPNLEEAMRRIREYVFYLEDERAKKAYGIGTSFGKWVIIEREIVKDRISILIVKEPLGF